MNRHDCVRQGDVLLVYIGPERPPGGTEHRDGARVVLAHGEATGHAHAIQRGARLFRFGEEPLSWGGYRANALLEVSEPTALVHEEHAPIDLPAGNYLVIRQREYAGKTPRYVRD